MILSRISIFFLIIFVSFAGHGQSLSEYIVAAEKEFESGNYYAAIDLYKKAININNKIESIQFCLAESYRKNRDYKNAEKLYRKIRQTNPEKFPLAGFWYAQMLKSQGKYSKASKVYKRFYKKHRTNAELHQYIIKSKHEQILCLKLSERIPSAGEIDIIHPDTVINSIYGEFGPVIIDSLLFYSTYKNFRNQENSSFKSRIITYNKATNSTELAFDSLFYNDDYHYSIFPGLSPQSIYFSKCLIGSGLDKCKIFHANLSSNNITNIRLLNSEINPENSNSRHPSITEFNNHEILIFSSDREEGFGEYDIWYSIKDKNGEFGKCINAGNKINTIENEITPFYFDKDTVLFFSSTWHNSIGGYDIFSSFGDFNFWEIPENIGTPINSSYDDLYYSFHHKNKQAFLVSNRKGSYSWSNESCCYDIYNYDLAYSLNDTIRAERRRIKRIEKLQRIEKDLKLLTPLNLYFDNDIPDPGSNDSITNTNINDLLIKYFSQIENYNNEFSTGLKGKEKTEASQLINDFFYNDVEKGFDDLNLFVRMMEELLANDKKITLTLKAYSSPLNSKEYNERLAKRRINSLTNYLYSYNNSIFSQYLKNGSLSITQLAIGESLASSGISDDINDIRNSVYNPKAARERKITIIAITFE